MFSSTNLEAAYDFFKECDQKLASDRDVFIPELDKLIQLFVDDGCSKIILDTNKISFRARIYDKDDKIERFKNPPIGDFKGYDKAGSFIPPKQNMNEGRCNEMYERILYTAQSEICSVKEIKAIPGDYVSISAISILIPLKMANLNQNFAITDYKDTIVSGVVDATMLVYLYKLFSRKRECEMDYRLTQYITKRIKNYGYDGLAFRSSVYNGNGDTNYAIFNYGKCKAIKSKMVFVNELGQIKY